MGEMFNAFEMMKPIAARGIQNQKRNEGDYIGPDGILMCGRCREPRQKMMPFPNPTDDDPERTSELLVSVMCRCEREAEEKEKREKQAAEDMEKIRKLRDASLMDDKFRSQTFDSFEVDKYNGRNLKLCRRYATAFDKMLSENRGLLFWGDVGTGKSFSAACIANYLLERKIPVIMTSFVKLIDSIQHGKTTESEIVNRLARAKLVIFDDLGAERNTDYAIEKVYNLVDSRYRQQLPMILTTNLTLDEMMKESDIRYSRIYDRLFESCYPMQFTGPSWRKRAAAKQFDEMARFLENE